MDKNNEIAIQKGLTALLISLKQYLEKQIEIERIARVATILIKNGSSKYNPILQEAFRCCLSQQKNDGGWIGVEDSVWCTAFLKEVDCFSQEYKHGLEWIRTQELQSGGWGKNDRDSGRITITGLSLYLLPELTSNVNIDWLEKQWTMELCQTTKLSYKAAFYLMAIKNANCQPVDVGLFDKTIAWLSSQKNKDSGWGPWKGHPVGSSPFCTGVALIGLLQFQDSVDRDVITNGLNWIVKNQLEDGLWADHYIEEGSAWCFYALTEGYKFLKGSR